VAPCRTCNCCPCNTCNSCQNPFAPIQTPPATQKVDYIPSAASSGIHQRFLDKVGHENDYSWVTGQLQYVHANGGLWVVRYATVDTEDRFGGSVVLAPTINMKNFREGDLVSVHGEILNEGRATTVLGGALYRASHVDMIERAD
jgi:hypothetical protein